jgi:hypothetical protein
MKMEKIYDFDRLKLYAAWANTDTNRLFKGIYTGRKQDILKYVTALYGPYYGWDLEEVKAKYVSSEDGEKILKLQMEKDKIEAQLKQLLEQ